MDIKETTIDKGRAKELDNISHLKKIPRIYFPPLRGKKARCASCMCTGGLTGKISCTVDLN